ncbi:MAG: hypothetical protein ACTSXY_11385 [Promethearchaeota archaeon]
MNFKKPFLEISLISTAEKKKTALQIMKKFQKNFEECYKINTSIRMEEKTPIIRVEFTSKDEFLAIYERDLDIYEFLLENVINGSLDLEEFKTEQLNSKLKIKSGSEQIDKENYIVLKFTSNFKDPMRKKYNLTTKVDHIFGVHSAFEEVEDGFIKFFERKEDFEDTMLDNLKRADWEKWLKLKGIGISTEFAKNFLNLLAKKNI